MTAASPRSATCLLALTLVLGACADARTYPSLARRPAERLGTGDPSAVAPPPPTVATSGATTAELARLQDSARAAHLRFAGRRAAAERAAAGAGPLGSESWAAASVALAGLEEAHDQQSQALTAIDQMLAEQQVADAGAESNGAAAIGAVRGQVASDVDADGEVVTRLRERLGGR